MKIREHKGLISVYRGNTTGEGLEGRDGTPSCGLLLCGLLCCLVLHLRPGAALCCMV